MLDRDVQLGPADPHHHLSENPGQTPVECGDSIPMTVQESRSDQFQYWSSVWFLFFVYSCYTYGANTQELEDEKYLFNH